MSIDLRGIMAATYNTPTNFKESEYYYEKELQYKINETYQYASNTYEIGFEKDFGTLLFSPIVCRVCHAINPKTGSNLGDDFKDLKFFNVFSHRKMGERYSFQNSIWITTNTDNYHYNTQSAIVRRCNNTINFIDKNGNIINEPCIVDYSLKYANVYYNTVIDVPQGTINVIVQNNSNTNWIAINDRFIFGSQAFKVKTIKDYLRSETFKKKSVPLLEFEMFVDAKAEDDDFENGIANISKYENYYPNTKNFTGIYFTPKDSTVYQGEKQVYQAWYYIKGAKQQNKINFEDVTDEKIKENYIFEVIDDNSFSIMCLNRSYDNVEIKCSYKDEIYTSSIVLGGLY